MFYGLLLLTYNCCATWFHLPLFCGINPVAEFNQTSTTPFQLLIVWRFYYKTLYKQSAKDKSTIRKRQLTIEKGGATYQYKS